MMNRELQTVLVLVDLCERRAFDRFQGACPVCGKRELRIFETGDPIEVRCAACSFEAHGAVEFMEKLRARVGTCQVCGEPFRIPVYIRRKKIYCSPACCMRAYRARRGFKNSGVPQRNS